jgi:hypothetical protein
MDALNVKLQDKQRTTTRLLLLATYVTAKPNRSATDLLAEVTLT